MPNWILLSKTEIEELLQEYNLGKHLSHKHIDYALDNTVYIVRTSRGKFVLKLYNSADVKFINYQLRLNEYLRKKGVPVAKVLPTKDNKMIYTYKGKNLIIQRFVEGHYFIRANSALVIDFAENVTKLHKALVKLNIRGGDRWERAHQFDKDPEFCETARGFELSKAYKQYSQEVKVIDKHSLTRSIIHGDLTHDNIMVKCNKIAAFIDFDDAHRDYLVYEIAIALAKFVRKTKVNKDYIKLFMAHYRSPVPLDLNSKKAIYYFIKHRFLVAINWAENHRQKDKRIHEGVGRWVEETIGQYKSISKIPVNEFVKLL
ncbi:homoserine kinase [Candidatus Woesearchaeota archaeon]|jgi:Ser/Thr protein kinase RdoA (MazF antagonist)|nr:homoserine kinase [Candidatus Woesearchaeota archaeon]MBT4247991.1 homoserine kinase [Candidatus Woesearchaeota archaeon]